MHRQINISQSEPTPKNKAPDTITKTQDHQLLSKMQDSAVAASQLLKSLSHPQRLLLLCQLTQGEQCVSELEACVGLKQPSLSQQLGVLRKDGLVTTRREGKHIYYRIANADALAVLNVMYERFCNTP